MSTIRSSFDPLLSREDVLERETNLLNGRLRSARATFDLTPSMLDELSHRPTHLNKISGFSKLGTKDKNIIRNEVDRALRNLRKFETRKAGTDDKQPPEISESLRAECELTMNNSSETVMNNYNLESEDLMSTLAVEREFEVVTDMTRETENEFEVVTNDIANDHSIVYEVITSVVKKKPKTRK